MDIKPLKSRKDYEAAIREIDALLEKDPMPGTSKYDKLDVLSTLAEKYEKENFPIHDPDPIEAIKFRMEEMDLTTTDLGNYIGSRGRASEILNKKRKLTIKMIRSLSTNLKIPADSLIHDYPLR